ncbi:MAG TPA: DciA family protein [Rubrivivax sp.]|nr:DciA family protein [Rubrivivax sp.]
MSPHKPGSTAHPGTLALGEALDQSRPLTSLLRRLQESQARLAAVRELLPETLRSQVRPGPLDDAGWSLLVPGGAAASKLRQLMPQLQAALQQQGWPATTIRIRVQQR